MKIFPLPVKKNKFGKRVADITATEYYRQIAEEVLEAHAETAVYAFNRLQKGFTSNIDRNDAEAEELVDIITCCVTRLEFLGYDETERQNLYAAVNDKNRKRGYFED